MTCPFCKHTEKRIKNLDKQRISYCANCGSDVFIYYDFDFSIQKEEEEKE